MFIQFCCLLGLEGTYRCRQNELNTRYVQNDWMCFNTKIRREEVIEN